MNRISESLKRFGGYIGQNRWTILTLIISVVMMVTIGRNALHGVVIYTQIASLEGVRDEYQAEITQDSTIIENLKSDRALIRFAREKYNMRSTGEDTYVFK